MEVELETLKASRELLKKNHNALEEQRIVLELGKEVFSLQATLGAQLPCDPDKLAAQELMALSEFAGTSSSLLGQVTGVVKLESVAALERVLFRATRGNAIFEKKVIESKLLETDGKGTVELVDKAFFMVFFAGDVLRDKISKICSYFGATLYKFPEVTSEQDSMMHEVEKRLAESEEVRDRGEGVFYDTLLSIGATYGTWSTVVTKEKMVFDALNMCEFDIKRHVFIAEGWVPADQYETVVDALNASAMESGLGLAPIINKLSSRLTPPTYIPVTAFTRGFQARTPSSCRRALVVLLPSATLHPGDTWTPRRW